MVARREVAIMGVVTLADGSGLHEGGYWSLHRNAEGFGMSTMVNLCVFLVFWIGVSTAPCENADLTTAQKLRENRPDNNAKGRVVSSANRLDRAIGATVPQIINTCEELNMNNDQYNDYIKITVLQLPLNLVELLFVQVNSFFPNSEYI